MIFRCLLALLLLIAPAAPALAQDRDALTFARAGRDCTKLRAYLGQYPAGRHVADARKALRDARCPDPEAEARAALEAERQRAAQEAEARRRIEQQNADLRAQVERERRGREAAERQASEAQAAAQRAKAPPPAAAGPAFNVDLLHSDVRNAALAARAAASQAEQAASRARIAAQAGETAAARARRGEAGTIVQDQSEGRRFEGDGQNNSANGHGVLSVNAPNSGAGDRYAGQFRSGTYHGVGVYSYAKNAHNTGNAVRYEGELVNGQWNGVGIYLAGQQRFVGSYRNNVWSGPGQMTFSSGSRYDGEWANNKRNGHGVLWSADGNVISAGIWKDGTLLTPLSR